MTTPPPITRNLGRTNDGRYLLVHWDSPQALYQWSEVTEEYARELAEPVRRYCNLQSWQEVFAQAADLSSGLDETPSEDYAVLSKWVADNLKGKQRRVMELLIEHNGRLPIVDLATDSGVGWTAPYDEAWNSIRSKLNAKLHKIGWRTSRHSNEARLFTIEQK